LDIHVASFLTLRTRDLKDWDRQDIRSATLVGP